MISKGRYFLKFVLLCYGSTAWKVSKYEVISGPYFPVFSENTDEN